MKEVGQVSKEREKKKERKVKKPREVIITYGDKRLVDCMKDVINHMTIQ